MPGPVDDQPRIQEPQRVAPEGASRSPAAGEFRGRKVSFVKRILLAVGALLSVTILFTPFLFKRVRDNFKNAWAGKTVEPSPRQQASPKLQEIADRSFLRSPAGPSQRPQPPTPSSVGPSQNSQPPTLSPQKPPDPYKNPHSKEHKEFMYTCYRGTNHEEIVNNIKELVKQGAQIDLEESDTLLHEAIATNNLALVQYLIGQKIKKDSSNGYMANLITRIFYRSRQEELNSRVKMGHLLKENGFPINAKDRDGNTALHNLFKYCNMISFCMSHDATRTAIKKLNLYSKEGLEIQDSEGNTPIVACLTQAF